MTLGRAHARPVEVVPVQQDRHQEQRPEQEAEAAGDPERRRGTALPDYVPGAVSQPGRDGGDFAAQPRRPRLPGRPRRAEQAARHRGRDKARRDVTTAPDDQGDRRTALGVAGDHVEPQGNDAAYGRHDAADGRRYGVRHDQLVLRHHVRQRGGKRRQEEPVHAEDEQDRHVERHAPVAQGHEYRGRHDENRAQQRRPDQDLAPRPAVDEDPGERADQRVRQVEDREGPRARRRARERRRVEEHVRPDPGGDDAVAGLRGEPGGEQAAEARLSEHGPQLAQERSAGIVAQAHPSSLRRPPVSGRPPRG